MKTNVRNTEEGLEWYKSLSFNQRMGLKECAHLITGIRWEQFMILFSPRERLGLLYDKMKNEGFII